MKGEIFAEFKMTKWQRIKIFIYSITGIRLPGKIVNMEIKAVKDD